MLRHITTPTFLIIFAIAALVVGIGGPLRFAGEPQKWVTAFAAAGAVAGFLFAAAAKFHSDARDRAFELHLAIRKDQPFIDAFQNTANFFASNQRLDVKTVIQLYGSRGKQEIKLTRNIAVVGNFFEDMAIAIKYKEINEEILEEFFAGMFIRYYEQMRNNKIIRVLRNNPPINNSPFGNTTRPDVLKNLDWLYNHWLQRYYYRWRYP